MTTQTYREGQTATNPKTGQRVVFQGGQWVNDTTHQAQAPRPKPSAADLKDLQSASAAAQIARGSRTNLVEAAGAVEAMGTGPGHASWLDFITPDEEDSWMGTLAGSTVGSLARAVTPQSVMDGREHLRTVGADAALEASAELKGVASDRDMGLLRMTGVNPYRTENENRRLIRHGIKASGLVEARARVKAEWISRFGSTANPSPNGKTYEEVIAIAERAYEEDFSRRQAERRGLPTPPPRRNQQSRPSRSSGGDVTIDLNGNPIP